MEWFITVLVFAGYLFASLLCLVAIVGGIYLAATAYKSRRQIVDEATLEHPKSGWKIYFKGTGGILLAIVGVVGTCFIVYHYWKVLLVLLLLLVVGGGKTAKRYQKKKSAKKKTLKKKMSKKKVAKKRYSR